MTAARLVASCVVALSALACGKSEPPKATDIAKKADVSAPVVTPVAAMQPTTQPAQPSVQAVDFEQLKALLPDVDGWTKSDVKGEELSTPVASSRAQARYRRNDSHVDLEITDTALSQLLLAPLSVFLTSGYAERSDDGFKRAVKVGGQPGSEDWNQRASRGEVTAVVASRFVVKATGHDVDAIDPVRKVVEAVDFSTLAAIK